MRSFLYIAVFPFCAIFLFSCNRPDPEMQRKAVFEICSCMGTKDALLIRDTIAMHQEIRMLHYTQCVFDHALEVDPFEPSFRKMIESNCADMLNLHDAFVEAGTKNEKAAN